MVLGPPYGLYGLDTFEDILMTRDTPEVVVASCSHGRKKQVQRLQRLVRKMDAVLRACGALQGAVS